MTDLEILIKDGCTEKEADKHLCRGTIVYRDFEENFEKYVSGWSDLDDKELERMEDMVRTREPIADWGIVEAEGKHFYIAYCL